MSVVAAVRAAATRSVGTAWSVAAAAALCAAAAGTVAFTVATVFSLHVPLPYWDEWFNVIQFRRLAAGAYGLGDLAAQHNEHRLLFPRLVFFADERLFGLSGRLDAAATLLLQAANAALLTAWMARLAPRRVDRALLGAFVALTLFTLRQEENFTNGFQVQFVGVFTAAASAGAAYVAALDRMAAGLRSSLPFFALTALCCLVATYTMANGVLLGGVLAIVAVLRRARWPVVAATAVLAAALAAMFFDGYRPGGDSRPMIQALADPLPYLFYVVAYLGNPLGDAVPADGCFGALGLALAAAAAWRLRTGRDREAASLKLFSLALFVMASAGATAYGRIALGTSQATESRYATPASLFWCAMVLFWFPAVATAERRRAWIAGLGAVVATLAAAALLAEASAWPALAERSAALRRVADSLLSGLYDAETASSYESLGPDEVALYAPFLREHRLAAFADPVADALGRPLAGLGRVAPPDACAGTVAARADGGLGADGVRLDGTARDEGARRPPRRIVVVDGGGAVVGFGSASLPSRAAELWWGYAKSRAGAELQAYAELADGAFCRLGTATVR